MCFVEGVHWCWCSSCTLYHTHFFCIIKLPNNHCICNFCLFVCLYGIKYTFHASCAVSFSERDELLRVRWWVCIRGDQADLCSSYDGGAILCTAQHATLLYAPAVEVGSPTYNSCVRTHRNTVFFHSILPLK